MEGEKPGFGFRPYDEELVGYYLHHKNLGNDSLVDGLINEINIYSVDPWNLRWFPFSISVSVQSREPVLYFFSRRDNKYANGNQQSRTTPSGFWKLTGKPVNVIDRWGNVSGSRGEIIGHKRVLTFGRGKNNSVSERTYVVCRLEYKGDDVNILSPKATDFTPTFVPNMSNSASSVVDQSFQVNSEYDNPFPEYQDHLFSGIFDMFDTFQGYSDNLNPVLEYGLPNQSNSFSDHLNVQPPQVPYFAPFEDDWDTQMLEQHLDSLERTLTRNDPCRHRPKKPVTGVLPGYSSDSDTDSMIGTDAWSSTDSVGSKDGPYHTPKDNNPSMITVQPLDNHEAQEQPKQLELQLQGKEKQSECVLKIAEDAIKKAPSTSAVKQNWIVLEEISQRNSRWIYLKNIIGLLLFIIFIIGWIILVG
uniref:NAC domain-containing protein n=1 Tax=Brassica oleracea var. oleracea TaxID=109376 RepID=A0A0D3C714_BRAOL